MINDNNMTEEEKEFNYYIYLYLAMYVDYITIVEKTRFGRNNILHSYSFKELFEKFVYVNYRQFFGARNPKNVFKSMISVFYLVSGLYMLTLAHDEMLKKVGDDYLNQISDILNNSFVDKSYCTQFDDRQKIKYIRNAISHFENGRLYKALLNGTIEIKLDKAKAKDKSEKPFHIIINYLDIHKIVHHLRRGCCEYFIPSADVIRKNLFYMSDSGIRKTLQNTHYYKGFTNLNTDERLVKQIKSSLHPHPDTYSEAEQIRDLRSLVENGIVDSKTFKYDDKQIDAFIACVHRIRNIGLKESEYCDPFDLVMRLSSHNAYPHPAVRLDEMRMLCNYTIKELSNLNNSIEKIDKKIEKYTQEDPEAYFTDDDMFLLFPEIGVMTAIAIFDYYIFVHMRPNEKEVNINGDIYDIERIRNSFVHGTWFSYYENEQSDFFSSFKYALYDCMNGQKNEGKWTWESQLMSHSELHKLAIYVTSLKADDFKNDIKM